MKSLNSPRLVPNDRLSIKKWRDRMKSQQSQKSSKCFTTNEGSVKTSIKQLLTMKRVRNYESQNFMCVRYEDIRVPLSQESQSFFNKLLCGIKTIQTEDEGCRCEPKCWVMQQWLEKANKNSRVYYNISHSETCNHSIQEQINKDIPRTQPQSKSFKIPYFQEILKQILLQYAAFDNEVSYVQGMNILVSVLVYHSRSYHQIKAVLHYVMITQRFRDVYLNNFKLGYRVAESVQETLKHRCHDLYIHLTQNIQTSLNAFILGWLFPMLGNIVPLEKMHLVISTFIDFSWDGLARILVVLFIFLKSHLMGLFDQTEVLTVMTVHNLQKMEINWDELIGSIHNIRLFYNTEKTSARKSHHHQQRKQISHKIDNKKLSKITYINQHHPWTQLGHIQPSLISNNRYISHQSIYGLNTK